MQRRTFNNAQRVVLVVGAGVALYVVGLWLTGLGSHLPTGWVGYAPLGSGLAIGGLHPWVRLLIWIAVVATWVTFSVTVLRTSPPKGRDEG